jgi:alkaline phosphatase
MTMKLRNRLIALVCLILFLGLGGGIFLTTTASKPFAVILFVGDNITPSALTAARIFAGGGDGRLRMEDFPNAAICRNAGRDFSVPDTASASTAIAAGKRVGSGNLSVDESGRKLPSLLETAASRNRSTGLITTGSVAGTTAAAYYAKSSKADNRRELAIQYAGHAPFDFVAGGGAADFESPAKAEGEQGSPGDGNDLPSQLAAKGTVIARSMAELESQPFWKKVPVLGLLSPGPLAAAPSPGSDSEPPSLSDLVRIAISRLQSDRHGYLLVVDDPMIGEAAAANDGETMLRRLVAFDQAVATARRYAGEKALVIVTGRETIGGLQLNGYPFLRDKGVAILAVNAQGYPSLAWSTGPGYSVEEKRDDAHPRKTNISSGILSQPSAFTLPSGLGVAGDVISLGVGQGSEKLHGFLDLTDVHGVVSEEL